MFASDAFHNLNYKGCPGAGATCVGTVIQQQGEQNPGYSYRICSLCLCS